MRRVSDFLRMKDRLTDAARAFSITLPMALVQTPASRCLWFANVAFLSMNFLAARICAYVEPHPCLGRARNTAGAGVDRALFSHCL